MHPIRSFRDLEAWKTAMMLVRECYLLTERLPRAEQFGLAQQLRRAAVSVPSNIAEGNGRRMRQPYANHVNIALASLAEVETQLELVVMLGLLTTADVAQAQDLAKQTGRLLLGLVHKLEAPQA